MNKMSLDREMRFAALKLIEQLYRDGKISKVVYRNTILDYADAEDIRCFLEFGVDRKTGEGGE